jgi:glucokinase
MIYFALNNDGLLYNLGDHGDFESADCTAQDMQLDAVWLINEFDAQSMAEFITNQLSITTSTENEAKND